MIIPEKEVAKAMARLGPKYLQRWARQRYSRWSMCRDIGLFRPERYQKELNGKLNDIAQDYIEQQGIEDVLGIEFREGADGHDIHIVVKDEPAPVRHAKEPEQPSKTVDDMINEARQLYSLTEQETAELRAQFDGK